MLNKNQFKSENEQINRRLKLAKLFFHNHDHTSAMIHLNEILKNKPHSAEAYKLLSQIKEAEGDHEAAVMNYKKSLELNASQQQNLFFDHFNNIHTPTKMSSPLNNNSNNRSPDNSQNDIERPSFTIEQVDQMFTAKLASIEKNFKDYFEFLKSTLLKNSAEISLIKQDMAGLKKTLTGLSGDNKKVIQELGCLKESFNVLQVKIDQMNEEDEEEYYDDGGEHYNYNQHELPNSITAVKAGDLSQFVKKKGWECQVCCCNNDDSVRYCLSCESDRYPDQVADTTTTTTTTGAQSGGLSFGTKLPSQSLFNFNASSNTTFVPPPVFNDQVSAPISDFNGKISFGAKPPIAPAVSSAPSAMASLFSNFTFGNINSQPNTSSIFSLPKFEPPEPSGVPVNPTPPANPVSFQLPASQPTFGTGLSSSPFQFKFGVTKPAPLTSPEEEVVFVGEKEPNPKYEDKVKQLKLPKNFYNYENKPPCKGCIGCKVDELDWNNLTCAAEEEKEEKSGGLFSGLTNNVAETKVDNISLDQSGSRDQDNSFVSLEKRKLLPENYQHVTGEENEDELFSSRAKLYRFDNNTKEWKERGIGDIKILKQKNEDIFRVLMRREVILKLICNHRIIPTLELKPFKANMLTWFARDFSETAEGVDEILAIKFKNEDLVNSFKAKVNECISKLLH